MNAGESCAGSRLLAAAETAQRGSQGGVFHILRHRLQQAAVRSRQRSRASRRALRSTVFEIDCHSDFPDSQLVAGQSRGQLTRRIAKTTCPN